MALHTKARTSARPTSKKLSEIGKCASAVPGVGLVAAPDGHPVYSVVCQESL